MKWVLASIGKAMLKPPRASFAVKLQYYIGSICNASQQPT